MLTPISAHIPINIYAPHVCVDVCLYIKAFKCACVSACSCMYVIQEWILYIPVRRCGRVTTICIALNP